MILNVDLWSTEGGPSSCLPFSFLPCCDDGLSTGVIYDLSAMDSINSMSSCQTVGLC